MTGKSKQRTGSPKQSRIYRQILLASLYMGILVIATFSFVRLFGGGVSPVEAPSTVDQAEPLGAGASDPTIATKGHGAVAAADDSPTVAYDTTTPSTFTIAQQSRQVQRSLPPVASTKPQETPTSPRERSIDSTEQATVAIGDEIYPLRRYKLAAVSSDPAAGQWWSQASRLTSAWDISRGDTSIKLAIIDSGFALKHQEFTNRWYENPGESGAATGENPSILNCTDQVRPIDAACNLVDDNLDGVVDNESGTVEYQNPSQLNCSDQGRTLMKDCNNIDDDSNGYTDDVTGWDFVDSDRSVQAGQLSPDGTAVQHGTLVAGVASATGDNGVGIAGVNWRTKILPLQAIDDDGYGDTVTVGNAIYYAISRGVEVINLSLGTSFDDPYVRRAIEAANAAGIVVVAATGNDGCDCIGYPAKYPEVIAVGAVDSSNTAASFSSWGAELDLMGPGVGVTSPTWVAANSISAYASGVAGTSFASPYIAGTVALLLAVDPQLTPLQVAAALTETADKPVSITSLPRSATYGFGLANPYKALSRVHVGQSAFQVYRLAAVSTGGWLDAAHPTEVAGSYTIISCSPDIASTIVYELKKSGDDQFTISYPEVRRAIAQGYTASVFTSGCLTQRADTNQVVRSVNVLSEFRDIQLRR